MTTVPASIRYNNPGAMWGGNAISKRWGATANIALADGLGQGNTIADFPDVVSGAAAQFDLWRTGYTNRTLDAAITKWSGGNSSPAYMNFLVGKTGLTTSSMITLALLESPTGIALLKAQAQWEAGKPYPMSDAQWSEAQAKVFPSMKPVPPLVQPKETPVTTTTTPATPATTSVLTTISGVAGKAEAIMEDVMKVEPTIAMFVPGSSVWQPFIIMAAPFIERALTDIAKQNGGDILSAVIELLQHVTPAQPNSTALSAAVPTPAAS